MLEYPRGSEWRKWDLHVHTPYSILHNGFGNDFDEYAKNLLNTAVEKEICAIGLTDYFSIQGYKHFRGILDDQEKLVSLVGDEIAEKSQNILFLPNIEFRSTIVITDRNGSDSRVNFHIIFSNEITIETIEEHFLRELKFTSESNPGSSDDRLSTTQSNLEALGKRLKQEHGSFRDKSDLYVGTMNAVVSHEDITKIFTEQKSRFKGRYLFLAPIDEDLSRASWDGQGHQTRKLMIQKCDMIFSSNEGTREFALGMKHPTEKDFLIEFKTLKPCIHGSDAHDYSRLFEPIGGRYTWIKADPTYLGLRQLLYEPESRVNIGNTPQRLIGVGQNATKFIDAININKTAVAEDKNVWFGGDICLNNGLVAIIGNKGSGKSALVDILGLLGNSYTDREHFSFLRNDRFLEPKANLGSMFEAGIEWVSGDNWKVRLDELVSTLKPEYVKYIPQSYLEYICSEIKETKNTKFQRELWDVIFSHVKESDRLGKESLHDLIEYLTSETEKRIEQLVENLTDINKKIYGLEEQATLEHKEKLESQLEQRENELKSHNQTKPQEVKKPEQDPAVQKETTTISEAIEGLNRKIKDQLENIEKEKSKEQDAAAKIAAADRLLTRINNLKNQYQKFIQGSLEDQELLGLQVDKLIILNVSTKEIEEVRAKAENDKNDAKKSLDEDRKESLTYKLGELTKQVEKQREKLDEPNRNYQNYLSELKKWESKRIEITGSKGIKGSVEWLKNAIKLLDKLPEEIDAQKNGRMQITKEIYSEKIKLLAKYRELYSPVQQFIDKHPISKQHGALQFEASIGVREFLDGLLNMIHQGRIGSFYGEREGREKLASILQKNEFASEEGVLTFVDQVMECLNNDCRMGLDRPVKIKDQLRQEYNTIDIYSFIYSLGYLKPDFELRWQGKPIDKLSPGERGNLLLIFYLLIDQRDVPLIIDQPEENLDNQTIASILVPAIKDAKERRQLIMVTHNPNIAVVCDADQVIHASIDKTIGNKVTYKSGSIENTEINQLIVDVLEGTKPAFDLRDHKYSILE